MATKQRKRCTVPPPRDMDKYRSADTAYECALKHDGELSFFASFIRRAVHAERRLDKIIGAMRRLGLATDEDISGDEFQAQRQAVRGKLQ